MTRNGKIARLPKDIREELNRRMEMGRGHCRYARIARAACTANIAAAGPLALTQPRSGAVGCSRVGRRNCGTIVHIAAGRNVPRSGVGGDLTYLTI
jgi:hypothetical protein